MSDLQKSKRHDIIDMFNDTYRYLDDIFSSINPEFEKYTNGQKKGYTEYMSNYSLVNLKH